MREILFRGKDAYNGEWICGHLLEQHDPVYKAYIVFYFMAEQDNIHTDIMQCDIYEVLPETVGQYTGLTDKNGKKIFEGDILKGCYDDDNPEEYAVLVVFWDNGWRMHQNAAEPDFLEEFDCRICEVIGNIHDNPELLKGGDENDLQPTSGNPLP